jgi:hypothetical protein
LRGRFGSSLSVGRWFLLAQGHMGRHDDPHGWLNHHVRRQGQQFRSRCDRRDRRPHAVCGEFGDLYTALTTLGILCARRERQRDHHAAKRGDEFSPGVGCHLSLPRRSCVKEGYHALVVQSVTPQAGRGKLSATAVRSSLAVGFDRVAQRLRQRHRLARLK